MMIEQSGSGFGIRVLDYNILMIGEFYSRSHDAVIRVYDEAGNVIETHGHKGDFKEW